METWFGDLASMPATFEAHEKGSRSTDNTCSRCHTAYESGSDSIAEQHDPKVDLEYDEAVVSMSAPKNGKFYVAGEKPVVTIEIKDSKGNPIDHTKVDATKYAAANLYVYGLRANSQPVLTRAAKIGVSQSRASANNTIITSGTPKGWTFDAGDTSKIAVNPGAV